MLKLIIVDDEMRIRRGLRKALPWEEMGIEVVAEAANGLEALKVAKEFLPDIMLLDTYMPLMNGLEVAKEMKEMLPSCKIIIVSGFDEFEYAQKAIEYGVFSYFLKPVDKRKLRETVQKAIDAQVKQRTTEDYSNWAEEFIEKNSYKLKQNIILSWAKKGVKENLFKQKVKVIEIDDKKEYCLAMFCKMNILKTKEMSTRNIPMHFEEVCEKYSKMIFGNDTIIVESEEDKCLSFFAKESDSDFEINIVQATEAIENHCGYICISSFITIGDITNFNEDYLKLLSLCKNQMLLSPTMATAKSYVDKNYSDSQLTLGEVAKKLFVSESHLSRLFKKELGNSFNEYLTGIRIEKAKGYLKCPNSKIYEVAEKVGYKTQHYFCRVFKSEVKLTPLEYKSQVDREGSE